MGFNYWSEHGKAFSYINGTPLFLCGLPEDVDAYLPALKKTFSTYILWFGEGDFQHLPDVKIFILLVSGKLLDTKNWAADVAFPYARMHHIPVLPVILEENLEMRFNARFDELQYVRFDQLLSEEPQDKKILDDFLHRSQLYDEIAETFHRHFFLSYRKKDIRQAKRLIQSIHRIPQCRGFSVWYDDNLVPGENFNDSIDQALKESVLFLLLVTPSILEPGNYVQQVEYPQAVQQKKHILAIEMEPTDRKLLAQMYPGLPPLLDGSDPSAVEWTLLSVMEHTNIPEPELSPGQIYLLAEAYWNGIRFETDHSLGLELFLKAGHLQCPEAERKLSSIYGYGQNHKRDYQKAIYWQERVVARYRAQTEQEDYDQAQFIMEMTELAQLYKRENMFSQAEQLLQELSGMAEEYFSEEELDNLCVTDDARKAQLSLASLAADNEDYEKAMQHAKNAMALCQKLTNFRLCSDNSSQRAECHLMLGQIYAETDRIPEAEVHHKQALDALAECWNINKDNDWVFRERYRSIRKIANIYWDKDNMGFAEMYYTHALKVLAEQLTGKMQETALELFPQICEDMADVQIEKGNEKAAHACYTNALKILNELSQEEMNEPIIRATARIAELIARLHEQQEGWQDAAAMYMYILDMIPEDVPEPVYVGLWQCHTNLGDAAKREKDLIKAAEHYDLALEHAISLFQLQKTTESIVRYAESMIRLASALDGREETEYLEKALQVFEALCKREPEEEYIHMRDLLRKALSGQA